MRLKLWHWLVTLGLFVFFVLIRLHNYDRMPTPGHAEELLYGWSGIYLIEEGVPQSWSTLQYPDENLVFDGIVGDMTGMYLPAKLYRPWLDEPPLYSLMSGGVAHLYGADRTKVLPPSYIRLPSVMAGIVTLALVFVVGWQFFSFPIGVLAMALYGSSPLFVFGSRLSVPENITALGVMIGLLLARKYLKKPYMWFALVMGLMGAALGLMKPTGFFMIILAGFISATKKRWSDVIILLLFLAAGVGIYAWYGNHYGWELFKHIVSIQGGRFPGWTSFAYLLNNPGYDIVTMWDGTYVLGFIAAIYFTLREKTKETKLVGLFFLFWVMVGIFGGSEQDMLPWYRYPYFPLLAIYGALLIAKIYKKPNFVGMVLVVLLMLTSRWYLLNAFRPTTPPWTFRFVVLFALLPTLLGYIKKAKWQTIVSRYIIIFFVVLGMWYGAKYIYSAFEIRCEAISCPMGPGTKFSEVKVPLLWRLMVPGDPTDMLTTKRPKF